MAATIVDTIDLFENAGGTPEKLASVRKLGPHAKPFEKLWRAVDEAVRQCGYHLRGSLIRAAGANTQPARVWMDGFLNFSPISMSSCAGSESLRCDADGHRLPCDGRNPQIRTAFGS